MLAQGGEEPTDPVVTGVVVPSAATVYAGRSIHVLATVQGHERHAGGDLDSIRAVTARSTLARRQPGPVHRTGHARLPPVLRATSVDDTDFYGEITVTRDRGAGHRRQQPDPQPDSRHHPGDRPSHYEVAMASGQIRQRRRRQPVSEPLYLPAGMFMGVSNRRHVRGHGDGAAPLRRQRPLAGGQKLRSAGGRMPGRRRGEFRIGIDTGITQRHGRVRDLVLSRHHPGRVPRAPTMPIRRIELAPDRLVRISTASYLEMRQSIARLTAERDAWGGGALIAEAQSDRRLMLDVIEQGIERYRGAIGVIRYLARRCAARHRAAACPRISRHC